MICPPRIQEAFKAKGFTITSSNGCFVLEQSELIPLKCVEDLLKSAGVQSPIVNQHRLNNVEFTLIPFKIPDFFHQTVFVEIPGLVATIWKKIESIPPSPPMTVDNSQRLSNAVIEFYTPFEQQKGHALDLGCGRGLNSLQLARFLWKVTAIDLEQDFLDAIKKKSPEIECIKGDITTLKFRKNHYELVVATEVFPYLKPMHWKKTLQKIYEAMVPGGHFVGTFFVENINSTLQKSLGAHFIDRGEQAIAMLQSIGFIVHKAVLKRSNLSNMCKSVGINPNHPLVKQFNIPSVVEFLAQKPLVHPGALLYPNDETIEKGMLPEVKP